MMVCKGNHLGLGPAPIKLQINDFWGSMFRHPRKVMVSKGTHLGLGPVCPGKVMVCKGKHFLGSRLGQSCFERSWCFFTPKMRGPGPGAMCTVQEK